MRIEHGGTWPIDPWPILVINNIEVIMSEDNENTQVNPEVALEKTGINEAPAEVQQAPVSTEAPTEETPVSAEEEKLILTQKEFDNRAAKIKAIAERKARREVEGKLRAEYEQQQAANAQVQQPAQQQTYQSNQPPSPDHIWDPVIGWRHKNMTTDEYSATIAQALTSQDQTYQQQSNVQPSVQQAPSPAVSAEDQAILSRAADQIDECCVELDDFEVIARSCFTDAMVKAAAMAPNGVKNLYEEAKKDPMVFYKLSKLSPDEQKFKVWEMQKERTKAPTKVQTGATPQPEPLQTNGSTKGYADMSFADKKAARMKEMWGD
jgi:hypothetical protein